MRPGDPADSMACATACDELEIQSTRRARIAPDSDHELEMPPPTNAASKRLTRLTAAILGHIAFQTGRFKNARLSFTIAARKRQRKPERRLDQFAFVHRLTRFAKDPGHAAPEEAAAPCCDSWPTRHAKGGPATRAGKRKMLHVLASRRRRELRERRIALQITQQALVHGRNLPRSRRPGGCCAQASRSARALRIARR